MIKIIGIGNILMCDDGISMKIIDSIEDKLMKLGLELECIRAETDFDYALDCIDNGDTVVIIDSTNFGIEDGELTILPLDKVKTYDNNQFFMHNMSLISSINKAELDIDGLIIGIEVDKICFDLELSEKLKSKFEEIAKRVYEIICTV
ncbi:hydrogenase maturation protease [Clostridium sp. YIM B02505]|uniref:Hydrogenase maturation protease n=1 Tax=Clostridium yunnanense TaxID=2800325 RepID=A0ABS1EKG0_9CLOT|nr:hydrogenase maturation protease [Clostridium yunnanense]MBK1809857.1 hydrogenase maturation protease [Clostridium yunnanense]